AARLSISRSPHPRRNACCRQPPLHASHARNLAGAPEVRSDALCYGGRPSASQICLGALRWRRPHVFGPTFCIHAGQKLLLSPLDNDCGESCSPVRPAMAGVAYTEASGWASYTDPTHPVRFREPLAGRSRRSIQPADPARMAFYLAKLPRNALVFVARCSNGAEQIGARLRDTEPHGGSGQSPLRRGPHLGTMASGTFC